MMCLASRSHAPHAMAYWYRPVRTDVCSMFARMPRYGPAQPGIRSAARMRATGQNGSSRHVLALHDSSSRRINEQSSGLLIRGRAAAGQRGAATTAGLGRHCVTGIVQVTAIFDVPRAPGPGDQVHTGTIAGICQVSQRSAGTGPTWSRPVMAGPSRPRLPAHVTCHPGLRVTMIHRHAGWRGSMGTSCRWPPIRTGTTPAGSSCGKSVARTWYRLCPGLQARHRAG
jgi:hypothetical protein